MSASTDHVGLSATGLTVTYRNGHTALRDASFEVPNQTIAALVGANGSGKSTLFKALMGFVRPAAGQVDILGMDVQTALSKNIVAYVPQSEEVDWDFPVLVEDVVMMGRYGHMGMLRIPSAIDRQKVTEALNRVNMDEFRKRQIGELSGGQKKRVFLARALAQEGKVILLDEPFTGVDVQTEQAIIQLLQGLRDEGHIILVSTHDLGSVPEYCDQTVLIKGTVLAYGPTPQIFTPENLQETFGGVLRHFVMEGSGLHDDDDPRQLTVFTDDERPLVMYGHSGEQQTQTGATTTDNAKPDQYEDESGDAK